MKNKGFSLVELLLVIVLMSIITLLVMPNINDILSTGKNKKYTSIEDILKTNLELYYIDYKEDIDLEWDDSKEIEKKVVEYSTLQDINSDINLDNCNVDKLIIKKQKKTTGNKITYHACITCGEEYTTKDCEE